MIFLSKKYVFLEPNMFVLIMLPIKYKLLNIHNIFNSMFTIYYIITFTLCSIKLLGFQLSNKLNAQRKFTLKVERTMEIQNSKDTTTKDKKKQTTTNRET